MSLETRQHGAQAVQAVENKKGEDVTILEMDRASGAFTDFFIVCSGTNPRQIQAISDEVERRLMENGVRPNSVEGYRQAEWVLLDYVDFVVHVFSERARHFYNLERLWKSATRLKPADLLKKPAARKPVSKATGKTVSARSSKTKSSATRKRERRRPAATKRRKSR